jgi:hypothetical protein
MWRWKNRKQGDRHGIVGQRSAGNPIEARMPTPGKNFFPLPSNAPEASAEVSFPP